MAWPPPGTPDDQHWAFRATQGQPLCGVEARIVDDDGQVLPNDGEAVGEVEVRGPWITGSYYRGRDESKFDSGLAAHRRRRSHRRAGLHHPDRPRQGRDQVRRRMDLVGRAGERLDRASGRGRGRRGRGSRRALAGAAAGRRRRPEGSGVSADDLRKFLADKVVRWWLPERWTFVDEIPRTSVGKYDKKTIRSRYAEDVYEVSEARE